MAQGSTKGIPIDTDGTLSDNSDLLVPSQKAVKTYADTKQTALVSGTTIKTINGNSLLGSGDLTVGGGTFSGTMDDITDGTTYVKTENNYTDADASKLSGIAAGAEVNVNADWNAVSGDAQILNKPTLLTMGDVYPVGSIYISVVSTNPATLLGVGTWTAFATGRTLVGIDAGQTEFDTVEETGGAKTHTLTESEMPSHTHIQNAHTHTQDAHTHIQDAHTHIQNAHNHVQRYQATTTGTGSGPTTAPDTSSSNTTNYGITTADTTAVNQNTTAVNQNTTATNQNTTATNQNTGGGSAHNNLQPYIVVYMWKRTA